MGGGNRLFGTENSVPIFRGNKSIVEVSSESTNPTKLPDNEPLRSGKIDTATRCFDLLCVGKYSSKSSEPKLDIKPADKIPNLITKNRDGVIVYTEPTYMCTIKAPKGQNVWVNVKLENKTGDLSTNYMCLGLKKRGEDDYYDILSENNASRYVDVLETDTVELIPLVSSTELPTYTEVKVGDEVKLDGVSASALDFGSVYRVQITLSPDRWVKESCDLWKIDNSRGDPWACNGDIAIGVTMNQERQANSQILMVSQYTGQLAYSFNGVHWISANYTFSKNTWGVHPAYGNGIWCIVGWNNTPGIMRSIDYGQIWTNTVSIGARVLAFNDGIFMTVTENGEVLTSSDAECWIQIGNVPETSPKGYKILIHGNDKWICGTQPGYIFWSKDGKGEWGLLSKELYDSSTHGSSGWFGGCYANGYFYIIHSLGVVKRSSDGEKWTEVTSWSNSYYFNIGYYKNKLYAFKSDGTDFYVGLFQPDGTI